MNEELNQMIDEAMARTDADLAEINKPAFTGINVDLPDWANQKRASENDKVNIIGLPKNMPDFVSPPPNPAGVGIVGLTDVLTGGNSNFDNIVPETAEKEVTDIGVTDVTDRITEEIISPVKFNKTKIDEIDFKVKQTYLLDITNCQTITDYWINGLRNFVLCTDISEFNYDKVNEDRIKHSQTELLPDTALLLKINTGKEVKTLQIGYMDACQAYDLLAAYSLTLKKSKLYLKEGKEKFRLVKDTDLAGLHIHL